MTAAMRVPLDGSRPPERIPSVHPGASATGLARRFAALTERSPVPTLLAQRDMRLAHVNDAFCTLFGRPAEDLLGTGWLAGVHPDDRGSLAEVPAAALEGGGELQARLVRRDGEVRVTVLRFASVSTPDGGAGVVGTVEDVTDRLAFAAELAHRAGSGPARPSSGATAGPSVARQGESSA